MKIAAFALSGIAGLPNVSVDLTAGGPRPADLLIIRGPEASGKTRLLELLLAGLEAIGPYEGIVRSSRWTDGERSARLELAFWFDERESREASAGPNPVRAVVDFEPDAVNVDAPRGVRRVLARYGHTPSHGKREYFPESRQRAWGARSDGLGELEQSLWRCSKDPQKYGFIPQFLALLPRDDARRRSFAENLARLSPTVRYAPSPTMKSYRHRGIVESACFSARGQEGLYLSELSSSEADAVLVAATGALVGLSHSIVVLDRPELHADPDRLLDWVQALGSIGTDNQWIMATASDRLASSVPASHCVSLGEERAS